nr:hypothetical protein [Mycolicibacterium sp. CH28]
MGTRGIWHDGWFANTVHPPTSATPGLPGWSKFGHDRWELFRPFGVVGDVVLTIDDHVVGSLAGMQMAGFDPMQTVSAGRSVAYSVTADYTSPNPFHGGVLDHVAIDFAEGGDHHPDAIVELGFARD